MPISFKKSVSNKENSCFTQIKVACEEGNALGLTSDELAFYDALTRPQAIKRFSITRIASKNAASTRNSSSTIDEHNWTAWCNAVL